MEKVKEVVAKVTHPKGNTEPSSTHPTDSHTTGTHNTSTGTGLAGSHDTAGHHNSNLANKADPRIDSDLDGSRNLGAAQQGPGGVHNNHGTTGGLGSSTHGTTGTSGYGPTGDSTNTGSHNSNLLNKADPRIDSDRDGSRNMRAAQEGPGAHHAGSHGTTGTSGFGSSNTGSTNYGSHNSNALNKVDPRIDSDGDGSRNFGAAQQGPGAHHSGNHGTTGGLGSSTHGTSGFGSNTGSTNAGPYDSNIANKADPRVDSDRDGSHNAGAAAHGPGAHNQSHGLTSGPGPAPHTQGPHKSDMLNKLDPRVDADRDGSKTLGQEKKY